MILSSHKVINKTKFFPSFPVARTITTFTIFTCFLNVVIKWNQILFLKCKITKKSILYVNWCITLLYIYNIMQYYILYYISYISYIHNLEVVLHAIFIVPVFGLLSITRSKGWAFTPVVNVSTQKVPDL